MYSDGLSIASIIRRYPTGKQVGQVLAYILQTIMYERRNFSSWMRDGRAPVFLHYSYG